MCTEVNIFNFYFILIYNDARFVFFFNKVPQKINQFSSVMQIFIVLNYYNNRITLSLDKT